MNLTVEQKEDLRHAALAALAIRHPAALSARQVMRAAKRDLPFLFEESDTVAVLELLCSLDFASKSVDELGTTNYWQATGKGVLKHERGEGN